MRQTRAPISARGEAGCSNDKRRLDESPQAFDPLAGRLVLPEITGGTSYGTPALLVKGTSFARLKDPGTLALLVPLEHKEMLMDMAPQAYYETDHYRGWPAVLIRLAAIGDAELRLRLADGWRHRAPKRLAASLEAARAWRR
jgi:hypothetical protein